MQFYTQYTQDLSELEVIGLNFETDKAELAFKLPAKDVEGLKEALNKL